MSVLLSSAVGRQVAYARDVANVTFSVAPAALLLPAAVRYTVTSQTRAAAGDVLAGNVTTGMLEWREHRGAALNLTLPVRACHLSIRQEPAIADAALASSVRCWPALMHGKAFKSTCLVM